MLTRTQVEIPTLTAYVASMAHDYLLSQWWQCCTQTGDLAAMLLPSLHTPVAFCAFFATPYRLTFCYDDAGIWLAAWSEPLLSGGSYSFWLRQDKRRTKQGLCGVLASLDFWFTLYPVLVVCTSSTHIAKMHKHFGFIALGSVPELFHGMPAAFSYMTRARYEQRRVRWEALVKV